MTDTPNPAPKVAKGPDFPSAERLRIYGDFMFLAMRSVHHQKMSVANLRAAIEPPILFGQYRIFRFDGIPRGLITWAHLSAEAEARYVAGGHLRPADWKSGDNLWLIDLIAPYPGLMRGMSRWIMKPGNFADRDYYFRRVRNGNRTRKIVHVDFERADGMSRILSENDFAA